MTLIRLFCAIGISFYSGIKVETGVGQK